jgi:hypothetical protein
MKFKFVKKVRGVVTSYNGKEVATGEIIELTGHFAQKALLNPDYEQVVEQVIVAPTETTVTGTPVAANVEPIAKKRRRK